MDKLTILQIGTVGTPVRKGSGIGGAEKVISALDKEFIAKGHNSIVAAPGDSEVYGTLLPTIERSYSGTDDSSVYEEHYRKIVEFLLNPNNTVDIIHDNPGRGFVNSRAYLENAEKITIPVLMTNHGSELPGLKEDHERLKSLMKTHSIYINAISKSQKQKLEEKGVEVIDCIYHGTPVEIFELNEYPQDYYFSLARVCKEKGQSIAIEVTKINNKKLIIAGSIEDKVYFDKEISPHLNEDIKYIGTVNDNQKADLYKNSLAFLMPILWPEPFGLVMIESLASGAPVIAFNYGAAQEIVEDGKTGYIIDPVVKSNGELDLETMTQRMAQKARKIETISRSHCRKRALERFTIESEANNYLELYQRLIDR